MGIIEDYFKTKTEDKASNSTDMGIVEKYLKSSDEKTKEVHPPISGVSKNRSDELNAEGSIKGGVNPRSEETYAGRAGNAIADTAKSGILTAASGIGEMLSSKSATGVGKIGTGILNTALSPLSGVGQLVGDVTGNKDFADKVQDLTGFAVPVKTTKSGLNIATGVNSKNESFRKLVEDIGPENAGYVAKEMRSNLNLTPADLSPSVKMGAQKLFAGVEGPHVNYLGDVTQQRLANAAKDLEQHMNTNLGPVVNPVEKLKELKDNIRAVGKEKINPSLAGAKPVDTNSVVKFIDNISKPGVNSELNLKTGLTSPKIEEELSHIKKYLTDGKSFRTDPNQLNDIQSMFRITSEKLLASQDGQSKRLGGILAEVRNKLVDAIDASSVKGADGKGTYKAALKDYRDEFHIQDAFEHGHDAILKNGKNISDRPEFFEKQVKDYSEAETKAAREGARLAYDTQMNAFKHAARRGTDIGDVEFNKRRMSALFGKEEADKMFKLFEDAKKVADTNNKLVQGSQTQMRNVQDSYFKPRDPDKAKGGGALSAAIYGGLPVAAEVGTQFLTGTPAIGALATGAALGIGKGLMVGASATKNAIAKKIENERNMGYAKMALPVEPIAREQLIQQLEAVANRPIKPSILNKVKLALPTTKP